MAEIHIPSDVPARHLPWSRRATAMFGTFFVVGFVSFFVTLARDADQAWRAYVVNWLFFTSISMGAVMLAVVTTIVKARWNWSIRRVSLAFVAFLPFSFVLLIPMLGLGESYFPWVQEMAHDAVLQNKAAYLNMPFLITRNVIGLLVLFGLAIYFASLALRPDMGLLPDEAGDEVRSRWKVWLTSGWLGQEAEEVRSSQHMRTMAPAVVLVYAVVMSVIAFDWAMSLEPHWFSTLFGAWFFMGAFWGGIACTALATVYLKRKHPEFDYHMGRQQLHDLGKLSFAFTVLWAYLFWSQYLVIWYGKLPWEQAWIVHRSEEPWATLSVITVLLCFVIPFAGLIGRKPKLTPKLLGTFTTVILVGLWLERYMLVVPSIHDGDPTITIWEPLIGLMFLGLCLGSVRWFLATFQVLQMWQPMVDPESLEAEKVGAP